MLVNTSNEEKRLSTTRFQEVLGAFNSATHVLDNTQFELGDELVLPPNEASVWELTKEL